jgi:Ni,Fe-hydrogenase I large subunit
MSPISIDPITRIEGHLGISVEVQSNRVTSANCKGEMFRGRYPMDAQHITQRICGICPVSLCMASILAQDDA